MGFGGINDAQDQAGHWSVHHVECTDLSGTNISRIFSVSFLGFWKFLFLRWPFSRWQWQGKKLFAGSSLNLPFPPMPSDGFCALQVWDLLCKDGPSAPSALQTNLSEWEFESVYLRPPFGFDHYHYAWLYSLRQEQLSEVRDTLQFNQASCEGVNIWGSGARCG